MAKMQIECPECGSQYIITSQPIQKIDKGVIHCYVCNASIFEYDGCASYYPFMVTSKYDHLNDIDKLSGLSTDPLPDSQ